MANVKVTEPKKEQSPIEQHLTQLGEQIAAQSIELYNLRSKEEMLTKELAELPAKIKAVKHDLLKLEGALNALQSHVPKT